MIYMRPNCCPREEIPHLIQGANSVILAAENTMSFAIYAVGYLVLILGVAYLAHLMHVPQAYILAVSIILFGIGLVTGVQKTRSKDPN
jgi:amino acid transporter